VGLFVLEEDTKQALALLEKPGEIPNLCMVS
jgi:hypothetical protein